jgi:hypothetical protein
MALVTEFPFWYRWQITQEHQILQGASIVSLSVSIPIHPYSSRCPAAQATAPDKQSGRHKTPCAVS